MTDPYAHLADRYLEHLSATLRGRVRTELVWRQLRAHLPPPPARVVDVGGGAGHQARRLAAAGYDVVLLDPSEAMLRRAAEALADDPSPARSRVRLVRGRGQDAVSLLGAARFDVALCHGVVMYLDDPAPLCDSLGGLLRPAGVGSVLAKNAEALALRPALQGRWDDALAAFGTDRDIGALGVRTRGDTLAGLHGALRGGGLEPTAWYGVRVLTDHLFGRGSGDDLETVLAAEWEAGTRDPYRRVGRLLHVLAVRTVPGA
ncbi:methyltransferase domain-containing protein [soil metagenome]